MALRSIPTVRSYGLEAVTKPHRSGKLKLGRPAWCSAHTAATSRAWRLARMGSGMVTEAADHDRPALCYGTGPAVPRGVDASRATSEAIISPDGQTDCNGSIEQTCPLWDANTGRAGAGRCRIGT